MEVVFMLLAVGLGMILGKALFSKTVVEEVEVPTVKEVIKEVKVNVPATVFTVKNENKNSAAGASEYLGLDVYEKPGHKRETRLMFTKREFNVAKKRAQKNKDEKQPK